MNYVDTSILVAALSNEVATERAQKWLARQDPSGLVVSEWMITEFSSAMSIKVRTGQVTLEQRSVVLGAFNRFVSESAVVVTLTGADFRTAARFADRHGLGLRAGDALHLAVAADHGAALHTLDRRLADAGPLLGCAAELLS